MRPRLTGILALAAILTGCGTTKWSDTRRTATEQLLISDAMDRAVSRLDFRAVAGKTVYLDSSPASGVTDSEYLTSALRQHMLASGCILKDKREEADYIVELRAGAIGTDRAELMIGVPATQLPEALPVPALPAALPEMTVAKRTEQRAVAKIAVFAYNRKTGRPVWQSGVVPAESKAKDIWVLGAGPFQRGTIYEGMKFAGDKISIPLIYPGKENGNGDLAVASEAYFAEPLEDHQQLAEEDAEPKPAAAGGKKNQVAEKAKAPGKSGPVVPAGHSEPAASGAPPKTEPPASSPPKKGNPPQASPPRKTEPPAPSPAAQIAKPEAPASAPAAPNPPAAGMEEPLPLPPSGPSSPLPPPGSPPN